MDDRSFQRELHALQQQLTGLSVQGAPVSSSMDPFTREVNSLNDILHLMEERLAERKASFTQSVGTPPTSMPSEPHSGELCANGRHHAVSLETRLDALTKTVSDLEDRIDSLDPKCVTPSASSDGFGDEYILRADFQNALPYSLPGPSQLYSPGVIEEHGLVQGLSDTHPTCETYAQSREAQSPQMAACLFPTKPEAASVPRPAENTGRPTSGSHHRNGQPAVWPISNRSAFPWFDAMRPESADEPFPQRQQTSAEGIAFRDREIARMDERLWTLQERLKHCEAAMTEDQITIARLRLEREECRAVAQKYRDRNRRLKDDFLQQERRLDVQISRNRELESWFAASKSQRRDLEIVLERLQRSYELAEARAFRRGQKIIEMEEQREATLRNHDKRLETLKDWCREKDFEIGQKVQVISRNSSALTQKEDEIEELQARLRSLERENDDCADESAEDSTDAEEDATQQERPSQSITNQDWYCDLIETDNRDYPEDDASKRVAAPSVPSGATTAAPAFQPQWLPPTEGPYNDGSIFYWIDPSSSEQSPQSAKDHMRPQILDD